jgi:hypothetical protein
MHAQRQLVLRCCLAHLFVRERICLICMPYMYMCMPYMYICMSICMSGCLYVCLAAMAICL